MMFAVYGVALLVALVVAVALMLKVRVPVVLGILPVLGIPLLAWLNRVWGYGSVADAATEVPREFYVETLAGGIATLMADEQWAYVAVLAAATVSILGAVIGAMRASKRWAGPVLVAMAGLVLTLLVSTELVLLDSGAMFLRGLLYLPLGVLTALAVAGTDDNGPDCAGIAGLSFAMAVFAVESYAYTTEAVLTFEAVANASPMMRDTMAASGFSYALPRWVRTWAMMGTAVGVAGVGVGVAGTADGVRRWMGSLGWVLVATTMILATSGGLVERYYNDTAALTAEQFVMLDEAFERPMSTALRRAELRTGVHIDPDGLAVDGETVADLAALQRHLERKAEMWPRTGREFKGELGIVADRRTTWASVRPVLETANRAGYVNYSLVVWGQNGLSEVMFDRAPEANRSAPSVPIVVEANPERWIVHDPRGESFNFARSGPDDLFDVALLGMIKDRFPNEERVILLIDDDLSVGEVVALTDHTREDPEVLVDGHPRMFFPFVQLGTDDWIPASEPEAPIE